ncbi:MAG: hypothetical protein ACRC0V_07575 [Fusobacteriaceae bacterium]
MKVNVKAEIETKVLGALYFRKADKPELIGRFNGILANENISIWPNHYKKNDKECDWIIKTSKDAGYKLIGELFFDEKTETLKGSTSDFILEIKKNLKKKMAKSPDFLIIGANKKNDVN